MARYHDPYYYYLWEYFSFPLHLVFFVFILFFVLAFSWYINYESLFEDLLVQVKIFLALVPLLLLLLVHCLSSGASFPIPLPEERESLHRAGGSPWGVALLLLFVLFMMAYQSSFHQRCFSSIHRVLDKDLVADVMLWMNWHGAVVVLVYATALWYLFERVGYNFLSFITKVFANKL
ncbi:hypothetical protein D0Y65_037757 [Glycine soja]|uniref:Reticulon domain-containing protein n=1 Tax=Glycine soja TaxID=3848 RepID=A0A445H1R6_GLYSO|nr:hypothetical protein D0Y65_037757 [Glycine soja]